MVDRTHHSLLLRLITRAASQAEAEDLARQIADAVCADCDLCRAESEPYWKLAGYFDLFLELRPKHDPPEAFRQLLGQLATGWEFHSTDPGQWAVWNRGEQADFRWSQVDWAHAEWTLASEAGG